MAAAVVTPLIIDVAIPLVVKLLDKLFPPKSGAVKSPAATEITAAIQAGLQNVNALPGVPLTGPQIASAVQTSVTALNAQGVLKGAATVIDGAAAVSVGGSASDVASAMAQFLKAIGK